MSIFGSSGSVVVIGAGNYAELQVACHPAGVFSATDLAAAEILAIARWLTGEQHLTRIERASF